jgi:hypothetical protein
MLSQLFSNFAVACQTSNFFFGLVPWYGYLPAVDFEKPAGTPASVIDSACTIYQFHVLPNGGDGSDIPYVLLAVVDDLLRIAGLVAVGFVIYAAIQYITSQGNADQASKAQTTIITSLVGLAIAMIAVVFVSYLGSALK